MSFLSSMGVIRFWRTALTLLLGITFFTSGMAKLYYNHLFWGWIGPVWLAERLQPFQLGLYVAFIAASQLVTGFLLLTRRFWLLGAVLLVPMLANILLVTISLQWPGTPYIVAVLLLMNLALLFSEHQRLRVLWSRAAYVPASAGPARTVTGHVVWVAGLLLSVSAAPISYVLLPLSYWLAIGGVVLACCSFLADSYSPRRLRATMP
ncbi:hypothetical protein MTX78_22220 [Hymenobacter tibetensis]|uniref:DoxX family membrane protein n=1 Tax=Hymenobacter tibetensis TaxID=497967 RepID=A0ABY4CYJ6_9BACT|nr:hypothetical protein [Hymenobacter tibetensis]UOG74817.1 hypothetical protein MTX78_22220 [Hymenobacter tibetensis]